MVSGHVSEELRALIYHSTFSVNAIQIWLKYGTLLVCVTSFTLLIAVIYYKKKTAEELANNEDTKTNPIEQE